MPSILKLEPEQREVLRALYWDEELSCPQIAKLLGVDDKTVQRWMVGNDIPRRSQSAAASIQKESRADLLTADLLAAVRRARG